LGGRGRLSCAPRLFILVRRTLCLLALTHAHLKTT